MAGKNPTAPKKNTGYKEHIRDLINNGMLSPPRRGRVSMTKQKNLSLTTEP
jgi:hypothetical protein